MKLNEARCQKVISKKSIVFVLEMFVKMLGIRSTLDALCGLSGENIQNLTGFSLLPTYPLAFLSQFFKECKLISTLVYTICHYELDSAEKNNGSNSRVV